MVAGPYDTTAACETKLLQFAQARHESLKDEKLYEKGEIFLCLKRPV
jgi:hypothetical protein